MSPNKQPQSTLSQNQADLEAYHVHVQKQVISDGSVPYGPDAMHENLDYLSLSASENYAHSFDYPDNEHIESFKATPNSFYDFLMNIEPKMSDYDVNVSDTKPTYDYSPSKNFDTQLKPVVLPPVKIGKFKKLGTALMESAAMSNPAISGAYLAEKQALTGGAVVPDPGPYKGKNGPLRKINFVTSLPEKSEAVVGKIETEHFYKDAPKFSDQLHDTGRFNEFRYSVYGSGNGKASEKSGIVELHDYLRRSIQHPGLSKSLKDQAIGMLNNLTFIGEKEYQEGVLGLAALWKDYLGQDAKNQLCIITEITGSGNYRKSDVYLRERILETFSDDELERYKGRIHTSINEDIHDPEHTKVVLLDDWTISGSQMSGAYFSLKDKHPKFKGSAEVHVLVASEERINNGLEASHGWRDEKAIVPLKSYFKAHGAAETAARGGAHISGTHSTVDFNFSDLIGRISSHTKLPEPKLGNVTRVYRMEEPTMVFESDGTIRRTTAKESHD